MATEVRHVRAENRYELLVDSEVVSVLGYERRDDTVVLAHTATEPEHRHRGHASALVAAVVDELDREGLRQVVRCPFIRWYLAREAPAG